MNRRDFLRIGAISTLSIPNIILGKEIDFNQKKLYLYNVNTGESFNEIFFEQGTYNLEALVELTKFLRDFRTNDLYPIDINLADYIFEMQKVTGKRAPLLVNSGYRSPKTQEYLASLGHKVAKESFHMKGKAIDIALDTKTRVSLNSLKDLSLNLKLGGIGYYPNDQFIHLDTGNFRYWNG